MIKLIKNYIKRKWLKKYNIIVDKQSFVSKEVNITSVIKQHLLLTLELTALT